jgi:phenylpropionate dioxygenase-like ring-hydroxylating dioxygenase large terminal subunit
MSDVSSVEFPETDTSGLPLTPLAGEFYTSEDWFQTDLERVWRKRWLFACHVSKIPAVGDYMTVEVGKDSVIIVRSQSDQFTAFHNVCVHRGAQLCKPGEGKAKGKMFVCPYHAWTYNLDGTLRAAPKMQPIDKSKFGTHKVWSEVWNGLIFINLDREQPAKSVAQMLEQVNFEAYNIPNAKVIAERQYLTDANWKVFGENAQECYHCALVHSKSLATVLNADLNSTAYSVLDADGETDDFVSYAADLRDGSMLPGKETQSFGGQYVCKRPLGDTPLPPALVSWFPNLNIAAFGDIGWVIDWLPVSATQTMFRACWFVHGEAVEGIDYKVDEVIAMLDMANTEDKELYNRVQPGLQSSAYRPGPYNIEQEAETRKFLRQYLKMIRNRD